AVGVPGPAPALFLVDATAEGVHHGVEVGGHVQAKKGDVVAGVAYDGDLGIGSFGYEPAQEAGTPDATRGHGNAHGGKSGNRGRALPAHPPGKQRREAGYPVILARVDRVIFGKFTSISRIPLDLAQDTRV